MKKIINRLNTEPFILHLPGNGMKDFYHYVSFLENKEIIYNDKLYVLFIKTPNIDSPLERQLIINNIPYTNVFSYIEKEYLNNEYRWNWMYKHKAIKKFLNDKEKINNIDLERTYFIVLDASDVIINKLYDIVKTYKENYSKKIAFCGTKSDFPNEYFYEKDYTKIKSVKSNYPVFLNCGAYICKYDLLKKLTNRILKYNLTKIIGDYKLNPTLINDDQYICKIMQKRHDLGYRKMIVDDYCKIFQSLSAGTKIEEENDIIKVL